MEVATGGAPVLDMVVVSLFLLPPVLLPSVTVVAGQPVWGDVSRGGRRTLELAFASHCYFFLP